MGRIVLISLSIFVLFSCGASASFPYRYYVLNAKSYDGVLRGNRPENNLDLSICTPTQQKQAPCLVLLKDELLRLKGEYESLQKELECYQSGKCKP